MKVVMIQDGVRVCPVCKGTLKKFTINQEMRFVCVDCKTVFKVLDDGQSERELKCMVVKNNV